MVENNQNYYCFYFPVPLDEIQLAAMYELGFESFEEKETTMDGYLAESILDETKLAEIQKVCSFSSYELIKQQNWNAIWESGFTPIDVDGIIYVRASFHPSTDLKYEIIIDPKMAFGTGHHATTYMVLSEMLNLGLHDKSVLDFGCGSGILAIAAEKMGAKMADAVDYDSWSVENTKENIELNKCTKIQVWKADNLASSDKDYDLILANITRDILIQSSNDIYRILKPGGIAIYSGFIPGDAAKVKSYLISMGVQQFKLVTKENWACLVWCKSA